MFKLPEELNKVHKSTISCCPASRTNTLSGSVESEKYIPPVIKSCNMIKCFHVDHSPFVCTSTSNLILILMWLQRTMWICCGIIDLVMWLLLGWRVYPIFQLILLKTSFPMHHMSYSKKRNITLYPKYYPNQSRVWITPCWLMGSISYIHLW